MIEAKERALGERERHVAAELTKLVIAPYRTGVLLLSYPRENGETGYVHAAGMRELSQECSLDFVMLIRRLRMLADELEATVKTR